MNGNNLLKNFGLFNFLFGMLHELANKSKIKWVNIEMFIGYLD